jgi:DNA-binding GntR family transcriptional regulator
MRRCCAAGNVVDFAAVDRAFHRLIVSAAGNRIVAAFYAGLRDRQAGIAVAALRAAPGRMAATNNEHAAIVGALHGADMHGLLALVRYHLHHAAIHLSGLRPTDI